MDVRIEFLRESSEISKTLRDDGWRVKREEENCLFAHHPKAPNEVTARTRLMKLGLLTSSSVRIEFRKPSYPIDHVLRSTPVESQ